MYGYSVWLFNVVYMCFLQQCYSFKWYINGEMAAGCQFNFFVFALPLGQFTQISLKFGASDPKRSWLDLVGGSINVHNMKVNLKNAAKFRC